MKEQPKNKVKNGERRITKKFRCSPSCFLHPEHRGITAGWNVKWDPRWDLISWFLSYLPYGLSVDVIFIHFPSYICIYSVWDGTEAGQVYAGEMGSGHALCPKAIIPTLLSWSLRPLLLGTFGALLSCGYSEVYWDWPLLSLAAAFLTSGNTKKRCNGSCGYFQLVLECHTNSKATNRSWGAAAEQPVCVLGHCSSQVGAGGYLGWHKQEERQDCSSCASGWAVPGKAGRQRLGSVWGCGILFQNLWFVLEHKKNSRMRDVVPEVFFPPSRPPFLWLPSPTSATSLDKRAF